jgi:hypothetical protein
MKAACRPIRPLSRETQTLDQIALWETSDARARRAMDQLLDASSIEPSDTSHERVLTGPTSLSISSNCGTTGGVIVVDASVLTAYLDERDAHETAVERLLELAESGSAAARSRPQVVVGPASTGSSRSLVKRSSNCDIAEIPFAGGAAATLAALRADTNLKLLTFDERGDAARVRRSAVRGSFREKLDEDQRRAAHAAALEAPDRMIEADGGRMVIDLGHRPLQAGEVARADLVVDADTIPDAERCEHMTGVDCVQ